MFKEVDWVEPDKNLNACSPVTTYWASIPLLPGAPVAPVEPVAPLAPTYNDQTYNNGLVECLHHQYKNLYIFYYWVCCTKI
jgi:hypothetical protein